MLFSVLIEPKCLDVSDTRLYSIDPRTFTVRLTVNEVEEKDLANREVDLDRLGTIGSGGIYYHHQPGSVKVVITAHHNLYGSLIARSEDVRKELSLPVLRGIPKLFAVMVSSEKNKTYRAEIEETDVIQALAGTRATTKMSQESKRLVELAQQLAASRAASLSLSSSSSSSSSPDIVPLMPAPFNEYLAREDLAVLRIKTVAESQSLLAYCQPLTYFTGGQYTTHTITRSISLDPS